MRRIMVTPTFAAGLGVVIAAVLAYPTSRTIFKYSAPNWGARHCQHAQCAAAPPGAAEPASARPGRRLIPSSPSTQPLQVPTQPSPSGATTASPSPGGEPAMNYQTVEQWDGGFEGQITITYPAGQLPAHWGLWFSYPSGIIDTVIGGRLRMRDEHTAVVTDPGKNSPPPAGNTIAVNFWITGTPEAPPGCSFDHRTCRFG